MEQIVWIVYLNLPTRIPDEVFNERLPQGDQVKNVRLIQKAQFPLELVHGGISEIELDLLNRLNRDESLTEISRRRPV